MDAPSQPMPSGPVALLPGSDVFGVCEPGWDGVPVAVGDRVYTAIRRVADHLVDHPAEIEARVAGAATIPDTWYASAITTPADLAPFTAEDLDEGRSRLTRLAQVLEVRLRALAPG